jgi:hypothetical protein
MSILVSSNTVTKKGPTFRFNCPACETPVSGEVLETVERGKLYFVIPVFKSTSTWITCPNCNTQLYLSLSLDRLVQQPPEAIGMFILYRASIAARILALLSCLLFWVPGVGIAMAASALYLARGTKGWPKTAAWLSIMGGMAVTITVALIAFMPK